MIYLVTGQPGHYKTAYAISWALRLQAEGRVIYADGIKDFNYEKAGFERFTKADFFRDTGEVDAEGNVIAAWQQCAPGSVFLVDECYRWFPSRANGSKVPAAIEALARHRHGGFDFILVTQKPAQIDSFLQGLIEQHEHCRSKWGFRGTMIKKWDHYESNSLKGKDQLSTRMWRPGKTVFGLYTSTEKDTTDRKVPWFVWVFLALLAFVGYGYYRAKHMFGQGGETPAATAPAGAVGGSQHPPSIGAQDDSLRARDYAAWMRPRIPGMPWTAPAWDALKPQGVPDLYCIAVDDGRCVCHTEQGTSYAIETGVCRAIARGGSYNPFRRPREHEAGPRPALPGERREVPVAPAVVQSPALPAGKFPAAGVGTAYVPPQALPWNPE